MLEKLVHVGAPNFLPAARSLPGGLGTETSQGVQKNLVNGSHKFLPFVPNGINSCAAEGQDVVSGHFTGCVMAVYQHNGVRKICHVSSGAFGDCSQNWDAIKQASVNVFEFKPSDFVGEGEQFETIYGLITADLQMYTIVTQSYAAQTPDGKAGYRTDSKFVKIAKAHPLR